jgi:hypothetical protein
MKVPNQKRLKVIGALQYEFTRIGIYIGLHNYIVLAGSGYLILKGVLPIPLWLFISLDFGIIAMLMVFDYMYVLPSVMSFQNAQVWEHNNPWRKYLIEMEERLMTEIENLKNR